MDKNRDALRVSVSLYFSKGEKIEYWYDISKEQFEENLRPLPRCREIDIRDAIKARELLILREQMADFIGKAISMAIMAACNKRDTVNGYTRDKE